jgi:peptide/nickel transport system substrate-binding protein
VVNEQSAKVTFKFPFAPFLDGASQAFVAMVSPTAVQKDRDAFLHHPIGTGFMKFDEWVLKDHITLSRNPDYNWAPSIFGHQGAVYLDKVTFRFYTDDPTRLAALESGDADMIDRVSVSEMNRIKSDSKYELVSKFQPGLPTVVFLDTKVAPTDDLAVRKALNYATNRDAICTVGQFGTVKPALGPLWESTPYYSEAAGEYHFDLDTAKKTLDEAGWVAGSDGIRSKDGKKLSVIWSQVATSDSYAQLLQAQWRAAGVDLQLNKMTSAAALQAITNDQVNVYGNSWNASDPVILNNLFLSSNIKGGFAWSKYASTDLDTLLNDGERTLDPAKRTDLYARAQKLIMDQALIVPLFSVLMNDGIHAKFKGLKLDFRGYEWLYDVHQT